jgi:peptide/nickel transport system permease protein
VILMNETKESEVNGKKAPRRKLIKSLKPKTGAGDEPRAIGQLRARTVQKNLMKSIRPRVRETLKSVRTVRKSLLAMVGIVLIMIVVIMALAAPLLAPPANPNDPLYIPKDFLSPKPPGAEGHLLGTGFQGADIYYGIIWGARTSINISLFVVLNAAIIGIVLGAISGYYGKRIDDVIMRLTDVFLSIPGLILAMAIATVLSRSIENIMFALILVWWPPYTRLIRGQVLSVRESTFVEAARAIGCKSNRILFRHIVPNSLSPMLVAITMDIGAVVLVAAGLSYLGFGAPTGTAEWGKMVSDGQQYFLSTIEYPAGSGEFYTPYWMVTFPGLMIFIFVMGFNLLGDALRDILDPRLRR